MFIYYGLATAATAAARETVANKCRNAFSRIGEYMYRIRGRYTLRVDCVGTTIDSTVRCDLWWKAIKWQHKTQHIQCKRLILVDVSTTKYVAWLYGVRCDAIQHTMHNECISLAPYVLCARSRCRMWLLVIEMRWENDDGNEAKKKERKRKTKFDEQQNKRWINEGHDSYAHTKHNI